MGHRRFDFGFQPEEEGDSRDMATATVTEATSPYVVPLGVTLVEFDNSAAGTVVSATLPAISAVSNGYRVTFVWWAWKDANSKPPTINAAGSDKLGTWVATGKAGLAGTTGITQTGAAGTWQSDGTQWILVA
jgi:hypothetical protein